MFEILLRHSDLKSIPVLQLRLIVQGLWSLYAFLYHELVRNTTKLNVCSKKQKYSQNVGDIVKFVVFQRDFMAI